MTEITKGVYLETKKEIIENQKSWDELDPAKNADFTKHAFWITTDNGIDPIGVDSESEALEYIK